MTIDPPRLLDDPSVDPALRGDLQHAVAAELHGLDLAAGLSQLRATTAGSTAASGSSLLAKLGLGTAVTGGAVALWLGLGGPSPDPGGPAAVAEATPTASDPASERAVDEHAPALGAERGPSTAPAIEPRPTVVPTEALEPEAVAPSAEPVPEPAAEPEPLAASPPDEADARSEQPGPDRESRRAAEPERRAASAGDDDGVLREARLVARARRALGRDPAAALALAEEAERDFPQGQLVEERRAIAIRALVALGRTDEATRRADPFLATYGRGAHAAAVRRALDGSPPN